MTERILDVSETPARIRAQAGRLIIERKDGNGTSMPLRDVTAVVLAHPQISITQPAIHELAAHNVCVVSCAPDRTPSCMLLPLASHSTQTERFARQATAGLPLKKRLWKQVVQEKLRSQGRLLKRLHGSDAGLAALAKRVRSGDPDNREAQGARRYWHRLVPGAGFRRNRFGGDLNPALNYGYAVLRAMCARSIVAVGLHPSLGIHHHNRYDTFCLASDLMEPFRPLVDAAAIELETPANAAAQLSRNSRAQLLEALVQQYSWRGESRRLADWIGRTATSLAQVYLGKSTRLDLASLGQ